jgi:hypothetical protein
MFMNVLELIHYAKKYFLHQSGRLEDGNDYSRSLKGTNYLINV